MTKRYTKDDIVEKAQELAKMIARTEQVDFFKRAEAQLNENQEVREKIASLKSLQQQAVNFQQYDKQRAMEIIEKKIEKVQEEIDSYPVVDEFKESQMAVNELLQLVTNAISNTVTNEIVESTGGDLLRGETGSYVKNADPHSCS
ncbi:hypothetical protein GOP80_05135 [Planococcaceae bacterium Storch 2/2-2]|nr:hypothetical protein [Planococcaceae bacterium Storch 2/2-2]